MCTIIADTSSRALPGIVDWRLSSLEIVSAVAQPPLQQRAAVAMIVTLLMLYAYRGVQCLITLCPGHVHACRSSSRSRSSSSRAPPPRRTPPPPVPSGLRAHPRAVLDGDLVALVDAADMAAHAMRLAYAAHLLLLRHLRLGHLLLAEHEVAALTGRCAM